MYPPEVLNYSIRSVGMGIYTFITNGAGLLVTFAFPYALEAIGWKTCKQWPRPMFHTMMHSNQLVDMINGAWDFVQLAVIVWTWVETKDKTLEDIDELLDGTVHHNAPVIMGKDPLAGADVDGAAGEVTLRLSRISGECVLRRGW
jgi:hypothetical protein